MDAFRDSAVGQIIRWVAGDKVLLYPEEKTDFTWAPLDHLLSSGDEKAQGEEEKSAARSPPTDARSDGAQTTNNLEADDGGESEKKEDGTPSRRSSLSTEPDGEHPSAQAASKELSRTTSRPYTPTRNDVERAPSHTSRRTNPSTVLAPTKTADGIILVEWYTDDDQSNPQNWSYLKKSLVLLQLCLYSFAAYGASSMYVSGEEGVMEEFHVGATAAALGLAMYVVGYGVGPLLFAPLSEIAAVGRNWVYAPTFFMFVVLSIPTAVVRNYAGLLVLRFLTGFFSSPCLANGGASIGDMYSFLELPIYLSGWTVASFWGPALGPVVTGFAVQAKGWRWGLWEIVWLSAPILVVFLFFYPETSTDNILRRRAQRLRKRTGHKNIKSKSEVAQTSMTVSEVVRDALIKPMEIFIKDPAVTFTNVYTALTYGIYYSFFEAFPLVYQDIYGFSTGLTGMTFVTIGIACILGVTTFLLYQIHYLIPDIKRNGLRQPEHRLVPALFGVVMLPAGYFLFGWTARASVPWVVSLIGCTILVYGNFLIFQCVFIYLPLSYPKYAASLFAANDFLRALFAAACVLFARPMFINLGIGGGVSLLAGLSCLGVVGMFALWRYGGWLRSRSTFAAH
ncbi:hypothetical protein B0A55_04789 [Friedmanniomyces simplex]|uniref:Cercosporin MFS transporter CTB4 n=1 Tax=Friedmanniomyces simplex TaxID=329884 RepID=A0A4U0XLR6_9PEZI|nr:hypothetical protein B0A55_04789 [Friedmanniomyces simplex]